MREIFADAGYWIAVLDRNDELHERARSVTGQLASCRTVTTQMVLVEFLNFMGRAGEHRRKLASQMVERLENSPNVEVVPQTSIQFKVAVERYASRLDQTWSVVDCASFLLMEERGIHEALAYDQDFEQAGFVALLRGGNRIEL